MKKQKSKLCTSVLLVVLSVCAGAAVVLSIPLNAQDECNNKKCKKVKHNTAAPVPRGTIFCGDCREAEDGIPLYRNCRYLVVGGGVGYELEPAQGWGAELNGGQANAAVECQRYSCSGCSYGRAGMVRRFAVRKNCTHDDRWLKEEEEETEEEETGEEEEQ